MKTTTHQTIIKEVAKRTKMNKRVINIIINQFYYGLRTLLFKNEEINVKGYLSFNLSHHYKKIIKKKGKNFNIRKRRSYQNRKKINQNL